MGDKYFQQLFVGCYQKLVVNDDVVWLLSRKQIGAETFVLCN